MTGNLDMVAVVGTGISVIGFVYMFFRNFKSDMNQHMDKLEERITKRMDSLDEKMFYLSTGRSLQDAILSEKLKSESNKE